MSGGGKKGGSEPTVPNYYAGVHFVLCAGPIDRIRKIIIQEKDAWVGNSTGGNITINKPNLFGGDGSEGGVKGTVNLAFGGPTQTANTYLQSKLGAIPAYRRVVSAILQHVYLGNHYYLKPWAFDCERIHVLENGAPQWYDATSEIQSNYYINVVSLTSVGTTATVTTHTGHGVTLDTTITVTGASPSAYNRTITPSSISGKSFTYSLTSAPGTPATGNIKVGVSTQGLINAVHVVRECFTNTTWGYGVSPTQLKESAWTAAALACYTEGLGFGFEYTTNRPLDEFISDVLEHIQGTIYVERKTGLISIYLIRKLEDLTGVLTIDSPKSVTNFERKAITELVSNYTVNYNDIITGTANSTTVHNVALQQRAGTQVSQTKTYNGVIDLSTAHKLAVRDAITLEQSLYSCTIRCGREAAELHEGSPFVLVWPDFIKTASNSVVMRVASIDLGTMTDGTISINCIQDPFEPAGQTLFNTTIPEWDHPSSEPVAATRRLVIETPYYTIAKAFGDTFAQDVSEGSTYILIAAGWPSSDSLGAYINTSTSTSYTQRGILDFCYTAALTSNVLKTGTTINVDSVVDIDDLTVGKYLQVGSECMEVISIAANVITVKRGVLDTVPQLHFTADIVYGIEDFKSTDNIEYLETETVNVKLQTFTSVDTLPLAETPTDSLTLVARLFRPYPPANVRINNLYWPSTLAASDTMTVTWATRNRILQTASLTGFYEGNITSEEDVTYSGELIRTDTQAVLYSFTNNSTTTYSVALASVYVGEVKLRVWSVREGYTSYQTVEHTFTLTA
jgi:hypothetical protein